MKLTILGTGDAMVTECYNTCFVMSEGRNHFLTDCGGGNRILKVLKDAQIPIAEIHDIFLTHEHPDHLLGIVWMIRVIGTMIEQGKYKENLRIYCHEALISTVQTIVKLTLQKKICDHMGKEIQFIQLESGDVKTILGCNVTFFDIESVKARQFGFTMDLPSGVKCTCLGDEPYNENCYSYVKGSHWLMHEAFCLYSQTDKFKPYEKSHSTVKDACCTAEQLEIPNLILYHTEEENLKDRKALYLAEGKNYYHGNLFVPDDLEVFWL